MKNLLLLAISLATILHCHAFFKEDEFDQADIEETLPTNIEELKKALCNKISNDQCLDYEKRKIVLNKVFDFTTSENTKEEDGCLLQKAPNKCKDGEGQQTLGKSGECDGKKKIKVNYNIAGLQGLHVGSNKVIVVTGKDSGIKGKGLKLKNVFNVKIIGLTISDINVNMIGGGSAIELSNVRNVRIQDCSIRNIGDYMVLSQGKGSIGVTLEKNTFLGETAHSPTCDRQHNWLWQFNGEGDMITLDKNTVKTFHGPCLRINAANNGNSHIYLISNEFSDLSKDNGIIELANQQSSIFGEKNKFCMGTKTIDSNVGAVSLPAALADTLKCKDMLGKTCVFNHHLAGVQQNSKAMSEHKRVVDYIKSNVITKDLADLSKIVPPEINEVAQKQQSGGKQQSKLGDNTEPADNAYLTFEHNSTKAVKSQSPESLMDKIKALFEKLKALLGDLS